MPPHHHLIGAIPSDSVLEVAPRLSPTCPPARRDRGTLSSPGSLAITNRTRVHSRVIRARDMAVQRLLRD